MHTALIADPTATTHASVRELPPVFRLSRAKETVGVTDVTLRAWEVEPDSRLRIHRYGGVVLVETASVFEHMASRDK